MALDPQDELTDMRFPRDGTLGQAALLRGGRTGREADAQRAVEHGAGARRRAASVVSRLLTERARSWSKGTSNTLSGRIADVEDLLVDMALLERRERGALRFAPSLHGPRPCRRTSPHSLHWRMYDRSALPPGAPAQPGATVAPLLPAERGLGRWVLHRAGIINVWQYDRTELSFAGGRVLLRGKNGAGKSKALEVLLPFLLDADTRAMDATGRDRTTVYWLEMTNGHEAGNHVG